jgi:hypothetical protein
MEGEEKDPKISGVAEHDGTGRGPVAQECSAP